MAFIASPQRQCGDHAGADTRGRKHCGWWDALAAIAGRHASAPSTSDSLAREQIAHLEHDLPVTHLERAWRHTRLLQVVV